MKAKVIETGKIVNVVPMDGNWCDPSETRYYSDKELDFSLVTDGWDEYRREAAKDILCAILRSNQTDDNDKPFRTFEDLAKGSVACADALIAKLKEK